MPLAVSITPPVFRQDSTILPIISGSGATNTPYLKIHDWYYAKLLAASLTYIPPNRTLKSVPIILRDNFFPTWVLDANISAPGGQQLTRTAGEGYGGAYYDTALSSAKASIQAKISSLSLAAGISLQDSTATISDDYNVVTVAHSMLFGQAGQGTIRELGLIVPNNATFKYEVGDVAMIELTAGIVRYYLIKADGTMKLIRTTRSKLTTTPKAEVMLYHTGSNLTDVFINSNSEVSTSFENIGVAYSALFWQKWNNARSTAPLGDTLEMADKRTQFTYPNQKTQLRSWQLTPKAKSREEFWKFMDFVEWHKNDKEFIFVDYARKDLDSVATEWWAKFSGAFNDQTGNACVFENSVSLIEDFRNDYIPRYDDIIAPTISLDPIVDSGLEIDVEGTADDEVLLKSIAIYLNGIFHGYVEGAALTDTANYPWDFSYTINKDDLISGVNSISSIATDYAGNSTISNVQTFTPDAEAPTVPGSFNAVTFNSDRIDLSWTASTDNVGVTSYEVRRATNAAFTTGVVDANVGNVTSYQATGLDPSTQYWFKVRARDASGNWSAYSSADSDTTQAVEPDDLSGLILWLKADAITGLNDGDAVTTWEDSSSANNDAAQATAANKPTYQTNELNGKPIVRFDGSNDYMETPSITALSAWTIFFVAKSANNNNAYLLSAGHDGYAIIHDFVAGKWEYFDTPRTEIGDISTSAFQIIQTTVGTTFTGTWVIGTNRNDYSVNWGGDLAEMIVYNRVLNAGELTDITNYLEAEWAL